MPNLKAPTLYVSAADMDNLNDLGVYQADIEDKLEQFSQEWLTTFVKQQLK